MKATTTTSCDGEGIGEIVVNRGKTKMRVEFDVVFPFLPKPIQVELPLFNGTDLEEWLASNGRNCQEMVLLDAATMSTGRLAPFGRSDLTAILGDRNRIAERQKSKLIQTTTVEDYQTRLKTLLCAQPTDFLQPAPTENLEDKVLLSRGGYVKERAEISEVGNEDITTGGARNQETVTKDNRELHSSLRERKAS
ncbi:hypothetical protein PVK06_009659 [Gossypium arboreum]|uniref:Uncharacterized protein n=1 Tax=Gossypium arboreum TaxID=29729 RepID=A0ABR0QP06_GOSAR|nr:hypothetical protein PVK06_009659 [Gossypium arboreum]